MAGIVLICVKEMSISVRAFILECFWGGGLTGRKTHRRNLPVRLSTKLSIYRRLKLFEEIDSYVLLFS